MRRIFIIPDYVLQKRVAKIHVFEMDHKHDNTAFWFILIKAQSSTKSGDLIRNFWISKLTNAKNFSILQRLVV